MCVVLENVLLFVVSVVRISLYVSVCVVLGMLGSVLCMNVLNVWLFLIFIFCVLGVL